MLIIEAVDLYVVKWTIWRKKHLICSLVNLSYGFWERKSLFIMFIDTKIKCKWAIFFICNLILWGLHCILMQSDNLMNFVWHRNMIISSSKMQCHQIVLIELIILKWMMEQSQKKKHWWKQHCSIFA